MHCLAQLNVPILCDLYNRDGEIHRPSRPCRPFGNPDDCIFHFYLSVDDLNPSGGALFEIQNSNTYQVHTKHMRKTANAMY